MSATYLDEIMAFHRARSAQDTRAWRDRLPLTSPPRSLRRALIDHRSSGIAVIAEIKRRSPSRGWLAPDLDAVVTARAYVEGGASAISVLTDGEFFGGSLADLSDVATHVDVPILRKDFTVSANDVLAAVEAGAGAILLIAAALEHAELVALLDVAGLVGIDALVEVHDEDEAQRVIDAGASLVGINQRDLRTFDVDPKRAERVVAKLPASIVTVAESGFSRVDAVRRAAAVGFDAVLVGEQFVTSPSPATAVREFVGGPIGSRA